MFVLFCLVVYWCNKPISDSDSELLLETITQCTGRVGPIKLGLCISDKSKNIGPTITSSTFVYKISKTFNYTTLHYITLSAFQTPPTPKVTSGASTITCYTKYSPPAQHAGQLHSKSGTTKKENQLCSGANCSNTHNIIIIRELHNWSFVFVYSPVSTIPKPETYSIQYKTRLEGAPYSPTRGINDIFYTKPYKCTLNSGVRNAWVRAIYAKIR